MPEGNCEGLKMFFKYQPENNIDNSEAKEEVKNKMKKLGLESERLNFSVGLDAITRVILLYPNDDFTLRTFICYSDNGK